MKSCPQCEREYPSESMFCRRDGSRLALQDAPVTAMASVGQPFVSSESPPLDLNSAYSHAPPVREAVAPPVSEAVAPPVSEAVAPPVSEAVAPPVITSAVRAPSLGLSQNLKCLKCRKTVSEDDPFCPNCGTPTTILPIPCPHCAQEHPPTLRFCPKTGQPISAKSLQNSDKRPAPVVFAIASLGVVILLLGIYFGFRHSQPSNDAGAVVNGLSVASKNTTAVQPGPIHSPPPAIQPPATSPAAHTNPSGPVTTFTDGIASASSFEPPHVAQYAFDGNPNTIWHTEEYQNAWISIKYPVQRHVTQVGMIVGSLKQFQESARIKEVRLRFSNGGTQILHFEDTNQVQTRRLGQPILTDSIKFEIVGLYPGRTNHLIIPEIVVRGYEQ